MKMNRMVWAALASAVWMAVPAAAQVRVLASNGARAVMEELRPQCERAAGAKLDIEYSTSSAMKQRIEAGEAFDAVILTTDLVDALTKEGKLSTERADFAKAGIGVGIRKGAPKPDIRTAEAMKRTLENAKAVTYAADGASRVHVEKMFERMGISEAMKKKTILEQGSTRADARVASGDADIVLTLESEILPAPGVELIGPIPAEYQSYVAFAAAVGAKSGNAKGARAIVEFLRGPAVGPVLKPKGMQPVR